MFNKVFVSLSNKKYTKKSLQAITYILKAIQRPVSHMIKKYKNYAINL